VTGGLDWPTFRSRAIETFRGEIPHQAAELEIAARFREAPLVVIRQIERIGEQLAQGAEIRSAWAVLRTNIKEDTGPHSQSGRSSDSWDSDRAGRVKRAEQWLRNAGLHYDRWELVYAELFEDADARLRSWADDEHLVERMRRTWQELRPAAMQVEVEAEGRAKRWKEAQNRLLTFQVIYALLGLRW